MSFLEAILTHGASFFHAIPGAVGEGASHVIEAKAENSSHIADWITDRLGGIIADSHIHLDFDHLGKAHQAAAKIAETFPEGAKTAISTADQKQAVQTIVDSVKEFGLHLDANKLTSSPQDIQKLLDFSNHVRDLWIPPINGENLDSFKDLAAKAGDLKAALASKDTAAIQTAKDAIKTAVTQLKLPIQAADYETLAGFSDKLGSLNTITADNLASQKDALTQVHDLLADNFHNVDKDTATKGLQGFNELNQKVINSAANVKQFRGDMHGIVNVASYAPEAAFTGGGLIYGLRQLWNGVKNNITNKATRNSVEHMLNIVSEAPPDVKQKLNKQFVKYYTDNYGQLTNPTLAPVGQVVTLGKGN